MSLAKHGGMSEIVKGLVLATALAGLPGCNSGKTKTPEERRIAQLQLTVETAWRDNQKLAREKDLLTRLHKLRSEKTTLEWFDNLTPEEARWLFPQAQKGDKPFDWEREELDVQVGVLFYDPSQTDPSKWNLTLYQQWYLEHVVAKDTTQETLAERAKEIVSRLRK